MTLPPFHLAFPVDDLAAARARAAGATVAETRLRHDHLVDALVELEAGVRLFVLGKRGEQADFAKGHLGGHLERVVRAAASRALGPSMSL